MDRFWEKLNNLNFKWVEFDPIIYETGSNYGEFALIRGKSGLNSFKISVKEFVEKTNAISLNAASGRYGEMKYLIQNDKEIEVINKDK